MMDKKEWEKKSEIISMVNFFFLKKRKIIPCYGIYVYPLVCVKHIHQIKKYVVHNILRFKEWVMKKKKKFN